MASAHVQQSSGKVRITFRQMMGLLWPYVKGRVAEQVKSVAVIIVYMIFFQTVILGIAVAQAAIVATGLALVVVGLTFFMEGLFLGLMPLGETIGIKLPQKSKLGVIAAFAFILGMGVTFAEPAIGILKAAGYSVKAWNAPLLFLLLNRNSTFLVWAVGTGVGLAVAAGMLRFMFNWSLKPFIYAGVAFLSGMTLWALFEPNVRYLTGVAWDCGAITTGPVTVPLVLSLGIGICRIVGSAGAGTAGFGVVTLASIFPIVTVFMLGLPFLGRVPQPTSPEEFFSAENRGRAQYVFTGYEDMVGYALRNADERAQLALFDGSREGMLSYLTKVSADAQLEKKVFGPDAGALKTWAIEKGTHEQRLAVFGSEEAVKEAASSPQSAAGRRFDTADLVRRNGLAAVQAIVPLVLFLLLVLLAVIREKLQRADEVFLGVVFALIGMGFFNVGIELGLAKLGNQTGAKLPSSFRAIDLTEERKSVSAFDTALVQNAVAEDGSVRPFFYVKTDRGYSPLPFNRRDYDGSTGQYVYTPTKGPLFGKEGGVWGVLVVLLFGFFMGYGATLAEPALNALGLKVEELSVGTFKKVLLMQAVAVGVGTGIACGVAKIVWDLPLAWILIPPYIVAIVFTKLNTEEFVNIAWDSAGVTTGPITVPLVLAMGLGVGGQLGVVEGFGILALASVWPILSVLLVGLTVTAKRKADLAESAQTGKEGVANA